jgi:hypothetical protein
MNYKTGQYTNQISRLLSYYGGAFENLKQQNNDWWSLTNFSSINIHFVVLAFKSVKQGLQFIQLFHYQWLVVYSFFSNALECLFSIGAESDLCFYLVLLQFEWFGSNSRIQPYKKIRRNRFETIVYKELEYDYDPF